MKDPIQLAWRPIEPYCLEGNEGKKGYLNLEQYNIADGIANGVIKPNIQPDPDYVAPIIDEQACPIVEEPVSTTYWKPINPYCTKDANGKNTGQKEWLTLQEYSSETNLRTGRLKNNLPSEPEYVAPVTDEFYCPLPPPEDVETIKPNTNLVLIFDDSGSNSQTLPMLQDMVNIESSPNYQTLQSILVPYYGTKANYLQRVKIVMMSAVDVAGDNQGERFLRSAHQNLNYDGGDTIQMVFQDEVFGVYLSAAGSETNTENTPLLPKYSQDISDFNWLINRYIPSYKMVVFQLKTYAEETGIYYDYYKNFLQWVKGGLGNYAGNKGLSGQDGVTIRYDVDGGGQPGIASAEYYTNILIEELNKIGFNL